MASAPHTTMSRSLSYARCNSSRLSASAVSSSKEAEVTSTKRSASNRRSWRGGVRRVGGDRVLCDRLGDLRWGQRLVPLDLVDGVMAVDPSLEHVQPVLLLPTPAVERNGQVRADADQFGDNPFQNLGI